MSGNARSDEIDTKFRQTARMIMDLTILANFSQIAQSEINSVEVKILALGLFASHGFYSFAEDMRIIYVLANLKILGNLRKLHKFRIICL